MAERDYDAVLYGASGFVGRRAAAYLVQHAPAGLRWAMAGRDREKLERIKAQIPGAGRADVLVADSRDQAAVDAVVSRTRVLLNTAGPFALYANAIVDACVRLKTHYVDITGETPWVRDLIDRYHEQAAVDGTRIIPCSGFDSVPSDLGAYLVVRHMQRELGLPCARVTAYFQMYGGFNGGTLASALNQYESSQWVRAQDPFLLNPPGEHSREEIEGSRDLERVRFDDAVGTWVGPYFMAPINTRVVRRSAALYERWQASYGPGFSYQECLRYDPPLARFKAGLVTSGLALFENGLRRPATRRLMQPLLPRPGTGPSERMVAQGWFRCELIGLASDGRRVCARMFHQGDPSNHATVLFVCESALGLALDAHQLPGGATRGGVLTPATGLADVLAERLRQAGLQIQVGV